MKQLQIKNSRGMTHVIIPAAIGVLLVVGGLGFYVMNSSSDKDATKTSQATKTTDATEAKKEVSTVKPVEAAATAKPTEKLSVNLTNFMNEDTATETKDTDNYAAAAQNDQATLKSMGAIVDENSL